MKTKSLFSKIGYICVYVSDMQIAISFYKNVLGLEPQDNDNPDSFFAFKTGEVSLALEPNGFKKDSLKTKMENPVLIQFHAASEEQIEKMNNVLESNGVILMVRSKKTEYGTITNFCDPDGNKLEVIYSP